ncbi:hypothetical protein N431DRAFT_102856 [Stipitochalara longipes BDJ]|nr:hypothetical protein N431DRAFT_102856 [Stipitochalara longipes BDJ]
MATYYHPWPDHRIVVRAGGETVDLGNVPKGQTQHAAGAETLTNAPYRVSLRPPRSWTGRGRPTGDSRGYGLLAKGVCQLVDDPRNTPRSTVGTRGSHPIGFAALEEIAPHFSRLQLHGRSRIHAKPR